jgi:hypothetical protein
MMMIVPALAALAACGRETASSSSAMDDALRNDLALASQAQAYRPQQFVSPMEQGYGAQPGQQYYGQQPYPYGQPQYQPAYAAAPVYAPAPAPVRRTSAPAARRSSSGSSSSGGSGTRVVYEPAPEQRTRVVKHTKRDAIIGATAGAVIGATTSRDRIKGGVIGAAAGGILGAVIGNNVDKKRVPY